MVFASETATGLNTQRRRPTEFDVSREGETTFTIEREWILERPTMYLTDAEPQYRHVLSALCTLKQPDKPELRKGICNISKFRDWSGSPEMATKTRILGRDSWKESMVNCITLGITMASSMNMEARSHAGTKVFPAVVKVVNVDGRRRQMRSTR